MMFATRVLAPLALTTLLADRLGRVINVSSGGMYGQSLPDDGDWESDRSPCSPKKLYARTKREQVVISELSARRLGSRGVVVHAMHPGWVDTPGITRAMPTFRTLTVPAPRGKTTGSGCGSTANPHLPMPGSTRYDAVA